MLDHGSLPGVSTAKFFCKTSLASQWHDRRGTELVEVSCGRRVSKFAGYVAGI